MLHISSYVWYHIKDDFLLFSITKDRNLHDTRNNEVMHQNVNRGRGGAGGGSAHRIVHKIEEN